MLGYKHRAFLLDISERIPKESTFQDIIDILARYRYNELFLFSNSPAPEGTINLSRIDAYCQLQDVKLSTLNHETYEALTTNPATIRVQTEARRSLSGRIECMRERMIAADTEAKRRKAERFLVEDLADGYNWHPLIVSLPGIIMGGNFALNGVKSKNMDLEHEINAVLGAPLGGYLLELGTLYLRGGAFRSDASEFFNILAGDVGYSRHPGITQTILDEVSGIAQGIIIAAQRWQSRCDWANEIIYAAKLLDAACHRRDETRLRDIRVEHGTIWKAKFLDFGKVESMAKLPRF